MEPHSPFLESLLIPITTKLTHDHTKIIALTELTATTSPATGAYTSDAAFTDSTEPKLSPAPYLAPTLGRSTKTTSLPQRNSFSRWLTNQTNILLPKGVSSMVSDSNSSNVSVELDVLVRFCKADGGHGAHLGSQHQTCTASKCAYNLSAHYIDTIWMLSKLWTVPETASPTVSSKFNLRLE